MRRAKSAGTHTIEIRNDGDEVERVPLDICYKRIHVWPPIGKQKRYPSLDLTIIHASEIHAPSGRKPVQWKLVTDLEVNSLKDAVETIGADSLIVPTDYALIPREDAAPS